MKYILPSSLPPPAFSLSLSLCLVFFLGIPSKLRTTFSCNHIAWGGLSLRGPYEGASLWGVQRNVWDVTWTSWTYPISGRANIWPVGIGRVFAFLLQLLHEHNFSSPTWHPSNFYIHCLLVRCKNLRGQWGIKWSPSSFFSFSLLLSQGDTSSRIKGELCCRNNLGLSENHGVQGV